jgi:hypothetical protein
MYFYLIFVLQKNTNCLDVTFVFGVQLFLSLFLPMNVIIFCGNFYFQQS